MPHLQSLDRMTGICPVAICYPAQVEIIKTVVTYDPQISHHYLSSNTIETYGSSINNQYANVKVPIKPFHLPMTLAAKRSKCT
jgi:hypothetical protein